MAYGDIGSLLDTEAIESSGVNRVSIVRLSEGYVALAYQFPTPHTGRIATYPVGSDGLVGAIIDGWNHTSTATTNGRYAFKNISGNVYAVVYRNTSNYLQVKTLTISPTGTITKTAIESSQFTGFVTNLQGVDFIVQKGSTTKYLVGTQVANYIRLGVVNIDSDGTNLALNDTWDIDRGASSGFFNAVHISGNIFAVVYYYTYVQIITFSVADNGTITKTAIDTEVVATDATYKDIIHVKDNIYAVFYTDSSNDSWVKTYTIAADGTITAIDSKKYSTVGTQTTVVPYRVGEDSSNVYVMSVKQEVNDDTAIIHTIKIDFDGNIGVNVDSLDAGYTSFTNYASNIAYVNTNIYALAWTRSPGNALRLATWNVETPVGNFYPTHALARVSSIRHIYRPGSYRLEATIGDVSTTVKLAQHETEPATVSPVLPYEPSPVTELKRRKPEPPLYEPPPEEKRLTLLHTTPGLWVPERTAREVQAALESDQPSLWQQITPWKEEAGETFGSEALERLKSIGQSYVTFFRRLFGGGQ